MNLRSLTPAALALALAAGALSLTATAQPPPEFDGPRAHHFDPDRLPKHLEALGLSDAQKAQIKALLVSKQAEREKDRATDRALLESLRALSPASPSYTQEVDRIATQLGQQHADRIRERAAFRAQEWAILTPSQQSQLAAMPRPEFKREIRFKHKDAEKGAQ